MKAWGCFALGTNSRSLLDEEEILSLAAEEEKAQEMFRRESLVHSSSSDTYKSQVSSGSFPTWFLVLPPYSEPDMLGLIAMSSVCTHGRTRMLLGYDQSDGSCSSSASLAIDKTGFEVT